MYQVQWKRCHYYYIRIPLTEDAMGEGVVIFIQPLIVDILPISTAVIYGLRGNFLKLDCGVYILYIIPLKIYVYQNKEGRKKKGKLIKSFFRK